MCATLRFARHKHNNIPYGIKFWMLCCGTTRFLVRFTVYTGASDTEERQAVRLFHHLCTQLPTGTVVFADRLFTCVEVCQLAIDKDLHWVGSMTRESANFPKQLQDHFNDGKEFKLGQFDGMYIPYHGQIIQASRWKDSKPVLALNTYHKDKVAVQVERWTLQSGKWESEKVLAPSAYKTYHAGKSGVDGNDAKRITYDTKFKTKRKWYGEMFFWALEEALMQAYIAYKSDHGRLRALLPQKVKMATCMTAPHFRMASCQAMVDETGGLA